MIGGGLLVDFWVVLGVVLMEVVVFLCRFLFWVLLLMLVRSSIAVFGRFRFASGRQRVLFPFLECIVW